MYFRNYVLTVVVVSVCYGVFFTSDFFKQDRVQAVVLPTTITVSICGDAIVNAGEVCDLGFANNTGGYASSTAERICNADCASFGPYCGDGILQVRFTEQCDDGNNTSGDLCSAQCIAEVPAAPPPVPSLGSIPSSGGPTGNILSELETKVVLRGKGLANANVDVLLDGEVVGTVQSDSNADFTYTTTNVTPGTATFGFLTKDKKGTSSIVSTVIFEVVQSAVTTVANILIPPTIAVNEKQVVPGVPLTISGESIPGVKVITEISDQAVSSFNTNAESGTGVYAFQVDTNSLATGFHAVKSFFQLSTSTKSGYGKSLNVYIGNELLSSVVQPDTNGDGKINLVDFSIFLTGWGTSDVRFDFNQDEKVNLADLSIMLFNWTG